MKKILILLCLSLCLSLSWAQVPSINSGVPFQQTATSDNGLLNTVKAAWEFFDTGSTATDSHVGNYNGINYNITASGNDYDFNGYSSYVNFDSHLSAFASMTEGSIEAWVYNDNTAIYRTLLCMSQSTTTSYIAYVSITSSQNVSILFKASSDVLRATTSTYLTTGWNHIVYTSDSSGNSVYINGLLASLTYTSGNSLTQAFYANISASSNSFRFGVTHMNGTNYSWHNNKAKMIRVYDTALTAEQIAALYDGLLYTQFTY